MTTVEIFIAGIIVAIIGYFLKKTMSDIVENTKELNITKTKLAVLETDHSNKHEALTKQMSDLTTAIKENTEKLDDFKNVMIERLIEK